jgi:hypothetical protein
MIVFREAQEVATWFVVFHPDCVAWWARLIPGRFKHVSAFAWVEGCRVWVFYDVSLAQTKVMVLPEGQAAIDRLALWTAHCSILKVRARARARERIRLVFSCVSAIRHLVGVTGGALRPDALMRDLLRSGAEMVFDGSSNRVEPCVAGRGDLGVAAAGGR